MDQLVVSYYRFLKRKLNFSFIEPQFMGNATVPRMMAFGTGEHCSWATHVFEDAASGATATISIKCCTEDIDE